MSILEMIDVIGYVNNKRVPYKLQTKEVESWGVTIKHMRTKTTGNKMRYFPEKDDMGNPLYVLPGGIVATKHDVIEHYGL